MSATPGFIPFNFNPSSVSVKTGNYTIPATKYAKVDVLAQDGGTFSIGGTVMLETKVSIVDVFVNDSTPAGADEVAFTVPSGRSCEVDLQYRLAATSNSVFIRIKRGGIDLLLDSSTAAIKTAESRGIRLVSGDTIEYEVESGEAIDIQISGRYTDGLNLHKFANFWVPPNTALTISGDVRYTVSEFDL